MDAPHRREVKMNSPRTTVVLDDETVDCCCDQIVKDSLHRRSLEEALKHKWIESEKVGRDMGEDAIRQWISKHWRDYLRKCWIEHLEGKHYWIELSADDFRLLEKREFKSVHFATVLAMLKEQRTGENLPIINWAHDNGLSRTEIEEVLEILDYLDVNSARLECELLGPPPC